MSRDFGIKVTTPRGECQVDADSVEGLVELLPAGLLGIAKKASSNDLGAIANEALEKLHAHVREVKGNAGHTNIARAGLELVVVLCYLRGMRIAEAVRYLLNMHEFKTSESSVGRYWTPLYKLGILPVSTILKED